MNTAASKNNVPATVVLSCLHTFTAYIRPRKGDTLFCRKCDDYKEWTSTTFNVVVKCDECRKLDGRGFGGKIEAEASALRHALKYRGHTATVVINDEVVFTSCKEPATIADTPQF